MINTLKHNVFSDNADFFDFTKMNLKEGSRKKQKYRVEMSLEWYFRPHLMPSGQRDGSFCSVLGHFLTCVIEMGHFSTKNMIFRIKNYRCRDER